MRHHAFLIYRKRFAIAAALSILPFFLGSCMSINSTRTLDTIMLVAHRGGAGLAPENTMAAFASGLEQGADAIEFDVHLSRDKVPVVIHDPLLARTTNGSGEVGDLPVEELKSLNAAARYFGPGLPQRIPTLDEVLELVKERAQAHVEIKLKSDGSRYPGMEEAVVAALTRHGMIESSLILSFDFPTLQTIKALHPRLRTCALISTRYLSQMGSRGPSAVAEELGKLGVDYVGMNERYMSPELYARLREQGLKVGVWTVNSEERMQHFAAMGVDFITTDRPDILRTVLKR